MMDAGYWNESQAAARARGADTGRAGRYAARHAADRQQLGDWGFPNLKIPHQNPCLHYFQTT